MDPTAVVHPTEPLLRNRLMSDGLSIWCPGDPVHLSQEAYRDLAHALIEVHDDDQEDAGSVSSRLTGDGSALSPGSVARSTGSGKRKFPDAVVTDKRSGTYKRGRGTRAPVAAGWLRGVSTATHDSDERKRDRHGNPSARGVSWRGRRGNWLRFGRSRSWRRWQY
jgi:hypothetical protein